MGGRGSASSGGSGGSGGEKDKGKKKDSGAGYSADTALIKYQDEGAFRPLNKNLRKEDKLTKEDQKVDKGLQKAMKPLDEDIVVYRGLGHGVGKDIVKAGFLGTITDKGYTSTSKSKSVAHHGSFQMGWKAKVVLPKGTKATDVNKKLGKKSKIKEEKEVIVNKGTKYGISNINTKTQTVTLVALGAKRGKHGMKVDETNFTAIPGAY